MDSMWQWSQTASNPAANRRHRAARLWRWLEGKAGCKVRKHDDTSWNADDHLLGKAARRLPVVICTRFSVNNTPFAARGRETLLNCATSFLPLAHA
jgi:hypothetical protein